MQNEDIFGLGLGVNSKSRDSRRNFTQTQKNEIRHQQNEKCAECHKKLDSRDIQYDHIKPWASGGKTTIENGRAVCASCHSIISHKSKVTKADKKPKTKADKKPVDDLFVLPDSKQLIDFLSK